MIDRHLVEEIQHVALSMFHKNFFGVHHGSVSARTDVGSFLINTQEAIFDEITESSLIRLEGANSGYRWRIASMDAAIHEEIYAQIPQAKYITYTMPPYASAYALAHASLRPEDYFGDRMVGELTVYDPGSFSDWYDRAPQEIANFFKTHDTHLMLVKGYGVYAYERDLTEMAKKIAVLENSARLLTLMSSIS